MKTCTNCGQDRKIKDILYFEDSRYVWKGFLCKICAKVIGFRIVVNKKKGLRKWVKK